MKSANAAAMLLRNASDLSQCRRVVEQLIDTSYGCDIFLGNLALQMLGKLGGIDDARDLFQRMAQTGRNLWSWSIMISTLCRSGEYSQAVAYYHAMNLDGTVIHPDMVLLSSAIAACSAAHNLREGRKLHDRVAGCGIDPDVVLINALVSMYVNCGCLDDARAVFDATPCRLKDAVTWNVLMAAYNVRGMFQHALELFHDCLLRSVQGPDAVTFVTAISAGCGLKDARLATSLEELSCLHGFLATSVLVQNAFINLYGKCASLSRARLMFDGIGEKSAVSWNSIIGAYGLHGECSQVLILFRRMRLEGVEVSKATYVEVVSSCCCGDGGNTRTKRKLLSQMHTAGVGV